MNVRILYILYFDGIGVSQGIDVNKTRASKECDICHYWFFLPILPKKVEYEV